MKTRFLSLFTLWGVVASSGLIARATESNPGQPSDSPSEVPASAAPKFSGRINEVVALSKSGVDQSIVVSFIKTSPGPFQPSADEIIKLRDMGISAPVLTAMLERGAELRDQSRAAAATASSGQSTTNPSQAPVITETPPSTYAGAGTSTYVTPPASTVTYIGGDYGYPYYSYPYYYPTYYSGWYSTAFFYPFPCWYRGVYYARGCYFPRGGYVHDGFHLHDGYRGGFHGSYTGGFHGGYTGGFHGGVAGGFRGGVSGGFHGGTTGGFHSGFTGGFRGGTISGGGFRAGTSVGAFHPAPMGGGFRGSVGGGGFRGGAVGGGFHGSIGGGGFRGGSMGGGGFHGGMSGGGGGFHGGGGHR